MPVELQKRLLFKTKVSESFLGRNLSIFETLKSYVIKKISAKNTIIIINFSLTFRKTLGKGLDHFIYIGNNFLIQKNFAILHQVTITT